ncbi:MAG: AAA family ATPase [Desulfotomaculales bacterium]
MQKELSIGIGLAVVVFLLANGYNIGPLVLLGLLAIGTYYLAQTRGLLKTFSKVTADNGVGVSFADVGGQAGAIQELREALDFIRNHDEIKRLGIRPLKGILLTGPPGTGKTLMAKAAAQYTDAVFLSVSGSEFIEMYAGVGAQRVRRLFQEARETARKRSKKYAVIFIDEIDILGGKRGQTTSHLEYDQTLNQLLVEMDGLGIDDEVLILVVAATNRPDMLDPALLRPGRFDRQVRVELPDREGRIEILRLHTRNKPLADDVDLDSIARETFGFSGAHLESLANEAAILAMREGAPKIQQVHFLEAIDKVIMGGKLDRRPSKEEIRRVAVHETGHAILTEILQPGSVSTVTITPRGSALGYIRQVPEDDKYLHTQDYLEDRIAICVAGAVAEEVFYGSRSTGAASDFEQAIHYAETLVHGGMSEIGIVAPGTLPQELKHQTISRILQKQEERVRAVLSERQRVIGRIVEKLLVCEKLSGQEFRNLLTGQN